MTNTIFSSGNVLTQKESLETRREALISHDKEELQNISTINLGDFTMEIFNLAMT